MNRKPFHLVKGWPLRISLMFLLLVLTSKGIHGQEVEDEPIQQEDKISIGLVVGGNLNSFNFNGLSMGFSGGVYFDYRFNDALSLRPEVKYSQLGGVRRNAFVDYSDLGGNVDAVHLYNRNVRISTADLPVILRISPRQLRSERFTPRILIGGYFAFAFDMTEHQDKLFHFSDGTEVYTSGLIADVSSYYEQAHYGVIGGIGFDFTGAESVFSLDIRYRQGINETSLVGFEPQQYAGSIRLSTISFDFSFQIFK